MSVDKNNTLISIIVPVYKVEKYLYRCIDSIINQTYKNLEIILVDDGSPDKCGMICDEFALKDERIKVIHQENGGLSAARNAGLDIAQGTFITFVDSDDTIAQDSIATLYCAAAENDADITMMNMKYVTEDDEQYKTEDERHNKNIQLPQTFAINNRDFIEGICRYKYSCSFCDKLFRTKIFKNYRFTVNKTNEDLLLLTTILLNEGYDILHINYVGYYYLRRQNSITTTKFSKSITDTVLNSITLLDTARRCRPELESCLSELVLYQCRTYLIILPKQQLSDFRKEYTLAVSTIRKLRRYILKAFFKKRDKLFLYLVCISPSLARKIVSLMRKD